MHIRELASFALEGAIAKIRREVLALVVAMACIVGAIYQGLAAIVLTLESYTGPALARLIVAAAFLVLGSLAIVLPRLYERNRRSLIESVQAEAEMPRHLQFASILEALLFGFSLARAPREKEKRRRSAE
ncbi:MAG: hypothetical protein AB7K04_00145 [Pseudorhodoplanes sp.]